MLDYIDTVSMFAGRGYFASFGELPKCNQGICQIMLSEM